MNTYKFKLDSLEHAEVKLTPLNYEHLQEWQLEFDGQESVIKKDESGIWMQRSKDNLNPEVISEVGSVIENRFLSRKNF